jgi:hypothetical protein
MSAAKANDLGNSKREIEKSIDSKCDDWALL